MLWGIIEENKKGERKMKIKLYKNYGFEIGKRENKKMKKSLLYNYVVEKSTGYSNIFRIWADPDNKSKIFGVPGVINVEVSSDVKYTVWTDKRHDIDVIIENVKELFV